MTLQWADIDTEDEHRVEAEPANVLAAHRARRFPLAYEVGHGLLRGAVALDEAIEHEEREPLPEHIARLCRAPAEERTTAAELRALGAVLIAERREQLTTEERAAVRPLVAELAAYLVEFLGEP